MLRSWLAAAQRVVVLTGAGVSAESGVPTFRDANGLWHGHRFEDVATPEAWQRDPGMVWQFYDARRKGMRDVRPNPGHYALAELERQLHDRGGRFDLITQNIDDLHLDAGSQRVTRLHGSIWQTRCTGCYDIRMSRAVPITSSYGLPELDEEGNRRRFEVADLPRCSIQTCNGILRPNVVWFGEALDAADLDSATRAASHAEVFLIVGTSANVYPAAGLAPLAKQHGAKVVEINAEATPMTGLCDLVLQGRSGEILPHLLEPESTRPDVAAGGVA